MGRRLGDILCDNELTQICNKIAMEPTLSGEDIPEHEFSKKTRRKIKKINNAVRFMGGHVVAYKWLTKAAMFVATVLSALLISKGIVVATSDDNRWYIWPYVTEVNDEWMVLDSWDWEPDPEQLHVEMTYVPDGFVLMDRLVNNDQDSEIYYYVRGKETLKFTYKEVHKGSYSQINIVNSVIKTHNIKDMEVIFIRSSNPNYFIAIWQKEHRLYEIWYYGDNLSRGEMYQIIENIK